MKNPIILGLPAGIKDTRSAPLQELFRRSGKNTGNFLFSTALRRVIPHIEAISLPGIDPLNKYSGQFDGAIIPAANWLSEGLDHHVLAERLEKAQVPCVVVGLGAQSDSTASIPVLSAGTLRLLSILSERCKTLSVRGEFTAEVLAHYGVKNSRVTGCPSLLLRQYYSSNIVKQKAFPINISVHTNRSQYSNAIFKVDHDRYRVSLDLTREAYRRGWSYIAQTEIPDMYFSLNKEDEDGALSKNLQYLSRVYAENKTATLSDYLRQHSKVFFDVADWISFASTQDFIVGTRIHGTIAGLLAGTPSLLIAHDTRTTELAVAMNVPYLQSQDMENIDKYSILKMYDNVDFTNFEAGFADYLSNFKVFFAENEITTVLN